MSTVEMSLRSSDLSVVMAEMRIWLDEQHFEPTVFWCREAGSGFVVRVDFKALAEAQAFADRFSGRIGYPGVAESDGRIDAFSPLAPPDRPFRTKPLAS